MKVCFIGLGSIAKRHIRNLKMLYGEEIMIDVLRRKREYLEDVELTSFLNRICFMQDELDCKYDAIFITNPTAMHYSTLLNFLNKSDFFFIEKPVFQDENEDITPFLNKGKTYYVACPLRYTNVIQYLKDNINFSEVYSMRCISSSYLPDWRPNIDYRETYSARKDMGGGVSIDLIHEWDYIYYLIGPPIEVKSIICKKSTLEIDSDDIAVYIAEYPDKIVELHLDYFGRESIRRIELFTKTDTIIADLIHQKIEYKKQGKIVNLSQERDDYQKREIQHFISVVKGSTRSDNDISEAKQILSIAKGNEGKRK